MREDLSLKRLRVLMTRQEIVPERLAGATVVVLDVFMATTTLLDDPGERRPRRLPGREPGGGRRVRERLDPENVLRGGEQDAASIDGYDHGPFPEEYAPGVVREKDVIFVTTNGTRAIADAARRRGVLLGCLRNAPAVARELEESGTDSVYLVCAGSAGRFTVEDFLGAAAILSHMDLVGLAPERRRLARHGLRATGTRASETEVLRESRAGRWFAENDRMDAFDFVADVGASDLVPEVESRSARRRLSRSARQRHDCRRDAESGGEAERRAEPAR